MSQPASEQEWQEGAGGVLLLAAAHETALLSQLEAAVLASQDNPQASQPPAQRRSHPQRILLLTLVFLNAVGLHRPWDLRTYTGSALGRLSGRPQPYSYRHVERFLRRLATANADEAFTAAVARWTSTLWQVKARSQGAPSPHMYVDGHRKPVYTDTLIPRGLIGNAGKILGSRTPVLVHDDQGHRLLVTTHRGDWHLTHGIPAVLTCYEDATESLQLTHLVVDREAMAADFLAQLHAQGRTMTTILKTNHYGGLDSFTTIGSFVPLTVDHRGMVLREVAPAPFLLARPDRDDEPLRLAVALIRDLRRTVPCSPSEEDLPHAWWADIRHEEVAWWQQGWQATPAPAMPTEPKLIPIVTTAEQIDAVALAQTYIHRWSAQEKVIKDFLLPLGLDVNHGLANVQRYCETARSKAHRGSHLATKLWQQTKAHAEAVYRTLNDRLQALEAQGVTEGTYRVERKKLKAEADAEWEPVWQRVYRIQEKSHRERSKHERYCREQRDLLRALEDLAASERVMHELDAPFGSNQDHLQGDAR